MRVFATIMMIVGAFAMLAAVLALFGPSLRAGGIAVVPGVTSIPGALVGGAVCSSRVRGFADVQLVQTLLDLGLRSTHSGVAYGRRCP